MKKSRFSEEQITYALRHADSGTPVADICRQLGVSEASFYHWRKKFGNLGISGMREMRQMREENARLKRLVADLTLDKHILGEVLRKNFEAGNAPRAGRLDCQAIRYQHLARVPACAVFARSVLPAAARSRTSPDCSCGSGISRTPVLVSAIDASRCC